MKKAVPVSALLALLAVCILLVPASSGAPATIEQDGFVFSVNGITLSVVSYDGRSADPVIPETVESSGRTYRVDSISADAFRNMATLVSVTIPSTVTIIRDGAFAGCANLAEVSNSGPADLGRYVFDGCSSLESYSIFDGTAIIGDYTFRNCTSLTSVTIPDSVTRTGPGAFRGCTSLGEIRLSESTDTVYAETFADCGSLGYVRIPGKTAFILNNVFRGCSSLSVIDICSTTISSSSPSMTPTSFAIGSEGEEAYCTINCASPDFDYTEVTDEYTHVTMNGSLFTVTTYDAGEYLGTYTYHAGDRTEIELPERRGYHVSDWDPSIPEYMTVGDISATAVWSANTYRVVFHSNDGSERQYDAVYTYNQSAHLATNRFAYDYHVFKGWSSDPDASVPEYADGQTVINLSDSDDVHLYAVWKDADFTVVFDANGGEGDMPMQPFERGVPQNLDQNMFSRRGYVFQGWAYDPGATAPDFYDRQSVSDIGTGVITLNAVWEPIRYTVVFNLEGGIGPADRTIAKYDEAVSLPDEFIEKKGHVLSGWSTYREGGGVFYPRGAAILNMTEINGATVRLYANWVSGSVSIVYEANGGSGFMEALLIETGSSAVIGPCEFTRLHSVFLGWSYSPGGAVDVLDGTRFTNTFSETFDLRLYAVWQYSEYEVVFNANGGTGEMAPITMPYGNTFALPACGFTNGDREFLGWSDRPGGNVLYTDSETVKDIGHGSGRITLYAVWKTAGTGFPVVAGIGIAIAVAALGAAVFVIRRR